MSTGLGKYSYRFKPLRVYLDGKLASGLSVIDIRRSVGGTRNDAAEVAVRVNEKPLRDNALGFGFDGQKLPIAEITTSRRRVLYSGALVRKQPSITSSTEKVDYVVRAEPFLFGAPVGFYPDYLGAPPRGAAGGQFQELSLHRRLLFNPEIDSKVRPNRDPYILTNFNGGKCHAFVEYDSTRTDRAASGFGLGGGSDARDEWTLFDIVQYLCWVLNPRQEFVRNPTDQDLELVFGDLAAQRAEAVRNFSCRHGSFLPEVLDDLLHPRGYGWFVKHERLGRRKLEFYRRGEGTGPKLTVDMGKPGAVLDPSRHNCYGADLSFDAAACVNRVSAVGSNMRFELTVELVRAWPAEKDSLAETVEQLRKSEDSQAFDAVRDVWRKWALNESGDYTGLRTTITGHFNLMESIGVGGFDDAWVPRRRQFLPCLTLGTDGKPIGQHGGCVVEFWNVAKEGGAGWDVIGDDMVCHLAEDECAVYFGGELPPERIYEAGAAAKVRITCTLESDLPVGWDEVGVSKASPTDTPIPLALDLSDQFHFRKVSEVSQFYAQVNDGTFKSDQVDDRDRLKEYLARVIDAEDHGQISGSLVLEGVDRWEVELGQPVHTIDGRDLNLNGRSGNDSLNTGPKYPTIVSIRYDVEGQATVLELEQFRGRPGVA